MFIGKEYIVKGKKVVITNFWYCQREIVDVEFSYDGKIYVMEKNEFLKRLKPKKTTTP